MTLLIELPKDLEQALEVEAAELGLPLSDYAIHLLYSRQPADEDDEPTTGAELVTYWQNARLIGTRQDIGDSQTYARQLRDQAEQRQSE